MATRWTFTAPAHAQTDGLSERTVRTVKAMLKMALFERLDAKWPELVPEIVFWHNTSTHTRMGIQPFRLVFGYIPELLPAMLAPPRRELGTETAAQRERRMERALSGAHAEQRRQQLLRYGYTHKSLPVRVGDYVMKEKLQRLPLAAGIPAILVLGVFWRVQTDILPGAAPRR